MTIPQAVHGWFEMQGPDVPSEICGALSPVLFHVTLIPIQI